MKNENELQKLREQLNSISEQINKLETKPEYEVGVWYKSESYFVRPSDLSDLSEAKVYGFKEGEWFNFNRDFNMNGVQKLVLATETEIKDMLEKESIKRGFKEGVTVNRDLFNRAYNPDPDVVIGNNKFHYDKEEDVLFIDDRLIYRQGLWATIVVVKEPKIEIGGYEVMFEKRCGDVDFTSIDGYGFSKAFWQAAKIISLHSKAKIMIGCSKQFDVSQETINLILAKL